jgi:hypothetical protein
VAENERGTVDLLSRVSTETQQPTVNQQQPITSNQTLQMNNQEWGRSLLSPENKHNKEIAGEDNYISPFSTEAKERREQSEEEYEQEVESENAVSSNRIGSYLLFGFIFYVLALCVGYHYTLFEDGVPQVVSAKQIEAKEYLSKVDEYLLSIQNLHSESIDAIESFTNETMGASEMSSLMKKSNEKIAKQQEEIKEIVPPEGYETLHSALIEIYSLQVSLNSAATNYASSKKENTFKVLSNINDKYEKAAEEFLDAYNKAFRN